MTITVTAANIGAQQGSKNAAITTMNAAAFSSPATDTKRVGGVVTQTSTFRFMANAWGETELEVKHVEQPAKAGSLNIRHSLKLRTNVKYDDDTTGVPDVVVPYECVIAWNHPSSVPLDVATMSRMLQALASLVLADFDGSTGIPDAAVVNYATLGITQNIV